MHYFQLDLKRNLKKKKNKLVIGGLWLAFLLASFIFLFVPLLQGVDLDKPTLATTYQNLILGTFIFLIPIFAVYFYFLFTEEERSDNIYARIVECGIKRENILPVKLIETILLSLGILAVAILMMYVLTGIFNGFSQDLNQAVLAFWGYTFISLITAYLMIEIAILTSFFLKNEKASVYATYAVYFVSGGIFHLLYRLTRFDLFMTIKRFCPFQISQTLFGSFSETLYKIHLNHIISFKSLTPLKTPLLVILIIAIGLTVLNQFLMKKQPLKG